VAVAFGGQAQKRRGRALDGAAGVIAAGTHQTSAGNLQTGRPTLLLAIAAVGAIRHRLIGMRNDRHDCHASGECERQGENQGYLFHGRIPSTVREGCQGSVNAVRDRDHVLEV
jgi:hypothetical protein